MAVLTSSPTDVLSHIAIRARAQGVLLATCFDAAGGRGSEAPAWAESGVHAGHVGCLLDPRSPGPATSLPCGAS